MTILRTRRARRRQRLPIRCSQTRWRACCISGKRRCFVHCNCRRVFQMWSWDDRPGSAGSRCLSQHDEATASTAKIIPLRPWFDPPPSRAEDPHVKFADEKGGPAEAKTADAKTAEPASVEPFRREKAKTEAKAEVKTEAKTEAGPEVKTEARTEAKTEAKTPPPGSTVVIEQAVPAPPLRTGGDKDRGGSSGGGGGGGGGGGNSPPLHKRSSDNEFRDVLGSGLASARRNLVTVGLFSVAVNLLVLAIPIYLFNMSDRVLTSRSTDTLVMLTIIVIIAIAAHVLMDMMRRIILMRVAVETEARLGGPVLSAAAKAAQGGS